MFLLINSGNKEQYRREIASMHRLRYRIFIEELKWSSHAIKVVNSMEFDQFDLDSAHYIVHLNDDDEVDACARLLPTNGPYLLGDVFPELVQTIPVPKNPDIWEVSRFCADRLSSPKNIVGQLVAAMLEFGILLEMKNYVSVSDIRIEPILRRCGWNPMRLGEPAFTGTDHAAAEIYEVNQSELENVRRKSGINHTLIFTPHDSHQNIANRIST